MDNEFSYDYSYIAEALNSINNAVNDKDELISLINKFDNLKVNVNIPVISNAEGTQITSTLNKLNDFQSSILETRNVRIIDEMLAGKFDIVKAIENNTLTVSDLVSICADYMRRLEKTNPNYYESLTITSVPYDSLIEHGLPESVAKELNKAFCNNLIEKNLMYTGEGIAEMAMMFTGLLAMYGLKLEYVHAGHFDADKHGLYLGTLSEQLGGLDCCNYYDWLCRCAGVNAEGYGPSDKWWYSGYKQTGDSVYEKFFLDGYTGEKTPLSEIHVTIDSPYYKNAKAGDILTSLCEGDEVDHIRMIVENDGKGYWITEATGSAEGVVNRYFTYEELNDEGYYITNMDNFYDNVTKRWSTAANTDDGGNNLLLPSTICGQVGLDDAHKKSLVEQFNARNKNPNIAKQGDIQITDGSTLDGKTPSVTTPDNNNIVAEEPKIEEPKVEPIPAIEPKQSVTPNVEPEKSTRTEVEPVVRNNTSTSEPTVNEPVNNVEQNIPTPVEPIVPNPVPVVKQDVSNEKTTETIVTNKVINNYYYNSSNEVKTNADTVSEIPIVEPIEPVEIIENNEILEPVTIDTIEPEVTSPVTPVVSVNTVTSNTSNNKTNMWPLVGAAAVGAVAVGAKILYDKENDKKYEKEIDEVDTSKPFSESTPIYGLGSNYDEVPVNTKQEIYEDSSEDYYE